MARATPVPPATASEPPSVKSFWTSTMISARRLMVTTLGSGGGLGLHQGGDRGLPAGELAAGRRQLRDRGGVPRPGGLDRLRAHEPPLPPPLSHQTPPAPAA